MRRSRVIRFVLVSFVLGSFIGLVSGLAFGGSDGEASPRVQSKPEDVASAAVGGETAEQDPAEPMTPERARAIGANEMGQVLVLMYHHIGPEETEWTRTPQNFRNDLALLKAEGFYPVNVRDLASGNIDIPAGKSPVVITFDDSSPGQYRILEDGTLDPDCAVGIMQQAVKEGGWASRASFYVLLDVTPADRIVFGQPDRRQEKVRNLVGWGYEVGSHTVWHLNLKKASTEEAVKQLAESKDTLENLIGGGYAVTSLAVPYGEYPDDIAVLRSGEHEGITYNYTAVLALGDTPAPSPFSTTFDPMRIPRIRASENLITNAIQQFKNNPGLRYVSDGDPTTVSAPSQLDPKLGELAPDLGRPVVRY